MGMAMATRRGMLGLLVCLWGLCGCALAGDAPIATPVIVVIDPATAAPQQHAPTAGPLPISNTAPPVGIAPTRQDVIPPSATSQAAALASPSAAPPTRTPFPAGLVDALPVMSGICFEAALDAAGQVFVLRNAEEHIRFYGLADNAGLCRRPVTRYPFDFAEGAVLAGLWSAGAGCVARHDIRAVERDDAAQTVAITLDFITEGDCPYELVRPFWVGIPDAAEYAITIRLVEDE